MKTTASREPGERPVEHLSGARARRVYRTRLEVAAALNAIMRLALRRFGAKDVAAPEVPAWVTKCFDLMAGTVLSNLPVDQDEAVKPGPKDKGLYAGLVRWLRNWIQEMCVPLQGRTRLVLPEPMEKETQTVLRKAFVIEEFASEGEMVEQGAGDRGTGPELAAELESSNLTDARDYTEGLYRGMRGLSGTGDGLLKSTDATDVYFAILLFWQQIGQMQSSAELHGWLTKKAGANRTGDKKRIEQLCRRIGLRFRGRGRPRKFYAKLEG